MTSLSFKKGYFVLTHGSGTAEPLSSDWDFLGNGLYSTSKLRAAVQFQGHADDSAKRIFDRILVKRYPAPTELPRGLSFLDPHQREGVRWILTRSRSYLAHAPGAGKTPQAIVASELLEADGEGGVTLVIVPPDLTANWEREIWKFTEWRGVVPSIVIVPESAKAESIRFEDAGYLICPDSMITKPWVLGGLVKMHKKMVIVDEASRFKESSSQRTIALFGGILGDGRKSPGLIHDARHAVLMDGSPLLNRPMELWAPTYAMAPESIDFMDQQTFGYRYCGAKMDERGRPTFKYSSNEPELKAKLRRSFMHVVGEEGLGHPERLRSMLFMNKDVRSGDHKAWERKNLSGLLLSELDDETDQGDLARFRRELGVRKLPFITSYVRDRLYHKDESILLFAWHREVCEGLAKTLSKYRPGLVMGGTPNHEREDYFKAFQAGRIKLLIANIAAMARGHNLQRADRVVFGEFSWTDELNKQCEKRASRRGRDSSAAVRCDYLVCPNSMDEVILRSVFTKANTFKKVIG